MNNADFIKSMKDNPGLYLVEDQIIVASIDGKLYGLVADNILRDEGWEGTITKTIRLFNGHIGKVGDPT